MTERKTYCIDFVNKQMGQRIFLGGLKNENGG